VHRNADVVLILRRIETDRAAEGLEECRYLDSEPCGTSRGPVSLSPPHLAFADVGARDGSLAETSC